MRSIARPTPAKRPAVGCRRLGNRSSGRLEAYEPDIGRYGEVMLAPRLYHDFSQILDCWVLLRRSEESHVVNRKNMVETGVGADGHHLA